MQLKAYSDYKRPLAEISSSGKPVLTPDSFSPQTKMASHTTNKLSGDKRTYLFEGGNGASDNTSHLISNSLSSSNHSSRKRTKSSDRTLSPLSLPRNNNDNNSVSSSNSSINTNTSIHGDASNQANSNVPFNASSWWKKGNEHLRDLMSTSITSASALPANTMNSCDNSCDSVSGNGVNNNSIKINGSGNGNAVSNSTSESTPFPSTVASGKMNSLPSGPAAQLLSSGTQGNQKPASWLKLLGEVASSGGNQRRGVGSRQQRMLQQQQELQAIRMENERNAMSGNGNPFLVSPQLRNTNFLNNRMAMQSRLPSGNILDPSNFLSDGMSMSQLQLQQQQQQLFQQQQFHLQQQSLYPLGFSPANGPLFSAQTSFLQQRQNQAQRQQIQRPAAARDELKIDGLRTSGAMGVTPIPGMDDTYQQDISFGEDVGSNANANLQKSTNDIQNQKNNMGMVDVNDLGFTDMVPMMPTSGTQPGFDGDALDVDVGIDVEPMGIDNNGKIGHQRLSRTPPPPKNESKPNRFPKQNPRLKEVKFRAYQAENWTEKFEELLRFREENGHCLVPNCHPDNPALAQWTKRQRYQYKLKQDGKRSTITDERVRALDEAGFVWDSHKAVWSERLEELKEFKKRYKHCNVPSRYKPNHQLAIWVKRQRRQWKNKVDRLPNCMTDERQRALEAIGFVWDMKKGKRSPQNSPVKQQALHN